MTLKVGVIGCGYISYAHISGWKANGCEVAALCDLSASRLNARAEEFGVQNKYTNCKEMLERENLDIVDIATPVSTHRALISYCCSRVANILCEKPFVDNMEDGEYLVRECKKYGCRTMVCQSYRWHPWYVQIKKELKNDVIGSPYYANIMQRISFDIPYGKENRIPLTEDQPFYEHAERLMLLEQGCHYFDVFRSLFGEPQTVTGTVGRISPFVKGDDLAVVTVVFPGLTAVLEDVWCSCGQQKTSATYIQGEKGSIYFDGTDGIAPHRTEECGALTITFSDGSSRQVEMDAADYYNQSFARLQAHFLYCIDQDLTPDTCFEDNLRTVGIALKAYESAARKRTIFMGE